MFKLFCKKRKKLFSVKSQDVKLHMNDGETLTIKDTFSMEIDNAMLRVNILDGKWTRSAGSFDLKTLRRVEILKTHLEEKLL